MCRTSQLTEWFDMRWSHLQKLIYNIWKSELGLQIHCNAYSLSGSASVGRYWITLGKEIIWDVPKDFPEEREKGTYNLCCSEISELIRTYLDTPLDEIKTNNFSNDRWGLIDIFKMADRRIGMRYLKQIKAENIPDPAAKVLRERLKLKDQQEVV